MRPSLKSEARVPEIRPTAALASAGEKKSEVRNPNQRVAARIQQHFSELTDSSFRPSDIRLLAAFANWPAPAKRCDDGDCARATRHRTTKSPCSFEGGVALRFPPQSKTLCNLQRGFCRAELLRVTDPRSVREMKMDDYLIRLAFSE